MDDATATPEELDALLAAYALGERSPELCEQILRAVTHSEQHRANLLAYLSVADLLPLAVPDAVPTADLQTRVVAAVEAARKEQPPPSRGREPLPRRWRTFLRPALRGFVVVAMLVLLAWNAVLQQEVARQQEQIVQQTTTFASLIEQPELVRIAVSSRSQTLEASGTLVLAKDQRVALLSVDDLPPLPASQTYQVWLFADDRATSTSGGLVEVDANQRGVLLFDVPPTQQPYEELGVTIEPAGGSPAPTSPWVLGAELDATE